jgi:enoyl-CoA hydratase
LPEIKLGLLPAYAGTQFLPAIVGPARATELMLTGRFINAERSLRTGLVSEVVPDDQLAQAARPYLDEMLTTTPIGLRLTKECLNMSVDAPGLEAAVAMEDRNQILCSQSADFREGMAAFLEKRPPQYRGS